MPLPRGRQIRFKNRLGFERREGVRWGHWFDPIPTASGFDSRGDSPGPGNVIRLALHDSPSGEMAIAGAVTRTELDSTGLRRAAGRPLDAYNDLGLAGLSDRVPPGSKARLSPEQEAEVAKMVFEGPALSEPGIGSDRSHRLVPVCSRQIVR
jgi:hypothetical protein